MLAHSVGFQSKFVFKVLNTSDNLIIIAKECTCWFRGDNLPPPASGVSGGGRYATALTFDKISLSNKGSIFA